KGYKINAALAAEGRFCGISTFTTGCYAAMAGCRLHCQVPTFGLSFHVKFSLKSGLEWRVSCDGLRPELFFALWPLPR
ncbi:MAG: hypothetical protein ACP5EP_12395, partial [Acidobacteriaceae bacterium]